MGSVILPPSALIAMVRKSREYKRRLEEYVRPRALCPMGHVEEKKAWLEDVCCRSAAPPGSGGNSSTCDFRRDACKNVT